jgi:hypothetical protein
MLPDESVNVEYADYAVQNTQSTEPSSPADSPKARIIT